MVVGDVGVSTGLDVTVFKVAAVNTDTDIGVDVVVFKVVAACVGVGVGVGLGILEVVGGAEAGKVVQVPLGNKQCTSLFPSV